MERAVPPVIACSGPATRTNYCRRQALHGLCAPAWSLLNVIQLHPTFLRSYVMLSWALAFFIIAIIAAVFGFTGIAAGAAEIAKILFVVFVVLFLVSLVAGLLRRP